MGQDGASLQEEEDGGGELEGQQDARSSAAMEGTRGEDDEEEGGPRRWPAAGQEGGQVGAMLHDQHQQPQVSEPSLTQHAVVVVALAWVDGHVVAVVRREAQCATYLLSHSCTCCSGGRVLSAGEEPARAAAVLTLCCS